MTTAYIQGALLDPEVKKVLESLRADLMNNAVNAAGVQGNLNTNRGTIVADLTAIRNAYLALTAKLDLDATVTDTNYAALTNPAALTTSA